MKNGNSRMRVQVPLTCVSIKVVVPQVIESISNNEEQQIDDLITPYEVKVNELIIEEPQ